MSYSSKEKMREYNKRSYAKHRDANLARAKKYYNDRRNDKEWVKTVNAKQRIRSFKRFYGITVEERNSLLANQQNKCAICGSPDTTKWCTDHCHKTKKVRGILCHSCNVAIGLMKDSPNILRAAANYLEKHA